MIINDIFYFFLKKHGVNFSDSSKLIGLISKAIKEHADKRLDNLSTLRIGKADYISREIIIKYYRTYFGEDGFGF